MKTLKSTFLGLALALPCALTADSTWYIGGGGGTTYADNYVRHYEYWKDSATTAKTDWPVATRDYILGGPREYCVYGSTDRVQSARNFPGKSLQVGNIVANADGTTTYQIARVFFNVNGEISCTGPGGLILKYGFFENWQENGAMLVYGDVHVKSKSDYPFYFIHAKTKVGYIRFLEGALHGDETAHLLVSSRYARDFKTRTATTRYPIQAQFFSSLEDYYGTLEFSDGLSGVAIGGGWGTGPTAAGTYCPGTFLFDCTNTLDLTGSPSNAVSVAHLSISTNFSIKVLTGVTNGVDLCSSLTVTESLTMPEGQPIKVVLDGAIPYVDPAKSPVRKFAFMKVKKSVKELAASDFVLDETSFAPNVQTSCLYDNPKIVIDYDAESDWQTVSFEFGRIYVLNTSSTGVSALRTENIAYWDGHAAGDAFDPEGVYYQADQSYLCFNIGKDALLADGGWKFAGKRLVMNYKMNAVLGGTGARYMQFDELVMRAGSAFLNWGIGWYGYWDFGENETYLNSLKWGVFKGKLTFAPYTGGWEWVDFASSGEWNKNTQSGVPRGYVLAMDIHANARPFLKIKSNDNGILLTSLVCLAGDNSDMKCPILVDTHCNKDYWELSPQLVFSEAKNLGGHCVDNFGIWLCNGATLWSTGTTTIDTYGRTLYIGHEETNPKANVKVSAGKTLTFMNAINVAGELRKRGGGHFVFGGDFHSCTGNLIKLSVPLRDTNRRVTVEEGTIEGLNANCLKDALVSFKTGTALVVRKPAESASADFRKYGIRGRCDGIWNLFDLKREGCLGHVPVTVVIDTDNWTGEYVQPLFTVSAAEAEALTVEAKRVNAAGEKPKGYTARIGKTVNEDGSVTFAATVSETGMILIVR